jgi:AbrB family looped-hinge helix DNA binding protein
MQDKYEKTKRVDAQGRVLIPSSIRETLDIHPDTEVSVKLDGDTIKINVAETRCCVCLKPVESGKYSKVYGGRGKSEKVICASCAAKIKEA